MAEGRPRPSLRAVGGALLAASLLLVLFVAYQLWFTGLIQHHDQGSLRTEFERSLTDPTRSGRPAGSGGTPTAGTVPAPGRPVALLVIPRIAVNQVVVEGVGATQLALGPGHYPGTPLPGQPGNAAIAGHRTTHGAPFYNLNLLADGDLIEVTTDQGTFRYRVAGSEVVAPGDGAVLDPTTTSQLTLTTCTPRFSAARRLVVVARLVSSPAPSDRAAPVTRTAAAGGTAPEPDPLTRASDWAWLVAWGVVAVALVTVTVVARRRLGGRWRWLAPLLAAPVGVVTLLYLFAALTVMVPASF